MMYCSKVQLHGLEEWCVGVVQLNQRTSLSRAVQAGSQAVRHSDNVNTETGKLIDTGFVFISRSSSVRMTGAVTISSEEARGFLNAQHWRERFHQRLGLNKLYADGSTVGMLSNIVATELGQCFKVSSCNTFFSKIIINMVFSAPTTHASIQGIYLQCDNLGHFWAARLIWTRTTSVDCISLSSGDE